MKKEDMEVWVAALRSGEYKQGREALRLNGTYCCLGVYAQIKGVDWADPDSFTADGDELLNDNFCGISSCWQHYLAKKNDSTDDPHSFNDIANIIETNYTFFGDDYVWLLSEER
jgi:hypothetical protein